MATNVKITKTGLFTKSGVNKFVDNYFKAVKEKVAEGMKQTVVEAKMVNAQNVNSAFKVKRPVFAKSWRGRVYNKKKDKLPSMQIHNSIFWFNAHEKNGIIRPKNGKKYMAVPLANFGSKRMGRKAWNTMLKTLRNNEQTFVRKSKNGKLILFAETNAENRKILAKSKNFWRGLTGEKKVAYGTIIPIAVLVPFVKTKKRYDVIDTNKKLLPKLLLPKLKNEMSFNNLI